MSGVNGNHGGPADRRKSAGLALLVIAYVSAFFVPYVFNGLTTLLPSYQDESQWLLYYHFIVQSYGNGFFPLWTPDLNCGMPFLAWSHTASLDPIHLVYAAFGFSRGTWVGQWIMATVYALGLACLIRRLGASRWATMLAVIVQVAAFILEGLNDFQPNLRTGCLAPWLFFFVTGLLMERRLIYLVGFVIVNLFMYLGGQVELIGLAYELIAVGLIGAAIYYRRQWRRVIGAYVLFAAAFAIGYLISQVQALPTLELTHFSIRGEGLAYGYFKIWSSFAINVVAWSPYLACGLVVALFAAAVAGARRSAVLFFCALLFAYCLCLIHDLAGVLWVLYHVPVLKGLLAHSRIIFHAEIILAAMIALGADRVWADKSGGWLIVCGALCLVSAAAWFGFLARRPDLLTVGAEPGMVLVFKNLAHSMNAGMIAASAVGLLLIFSRPIRRRWPGWPRWAFIAIAIATYTLPVMYAMPRNALDPFRFPPDYVKFMEDHRGLHRTQTIYAWDRWQDINIPLQSGILYGTRSTDGFITVTVDRYTRFLNAIIPGTFREQDGKIADLEATKVFKEGDFITDKNIRFLDLMGIKYLAAEQKNIKFADHYLLAYPDSPLAVPGSGAIVERRSYMELICDYVLESGEDIMNFTGVATGSLYIQKGDLLSFPDPYPCQENWLMVITGCGEISPKIEYARFAKPISRFLNSANIKGVEIDIGANGSRLAKLCFISLSEKGIVMDSYITDPVIVNKSKYFKRVLAGTGFNIFENPGVMASAFLVSKTETMPRDEALAMMLTPVFDPAKEAVVEGDPLPEIRGGNLAEGEGVKVESYEPERVEMIANAAALRLLLLTDVYFPGWRAWVDGREQRILPADYTFRGLPLDPGMHRITMTYQPQSFRLGLWASVASFLSLLCALTIRLSHKRPALSAIQ